MSMEIHYGKAEVSTYRTYATALTGLPRIPESAITGRPNVMLAAAMGISGCHAQGIVAPSYRPSGVAFDRMISRRFCPGQL